MQRNEVISGMVAEFGPNHQLERLEEELLELATAIKKYRRKVFSAELIVDYKPIPKLVDDILEETADVYITLEYIKEIFKGSADRIEEHRKFKMNRLENMLEMTKRRKGNK